MLEIDTRFIPFDSLKSAHNVHISSAETFIQTVEKTHAFVMHAIENDFPIYGVSTGFGESGKNYIGLKKAYELQQNLYRFHGCGVGEYLSPEESLRIMMIRLISLSKGRSGVSYALLKQLETFINNGIAPAIPSQGSVGASGDLTPLSYIAAALAGEREVFYNDALRPSLEVLEELNITPYVFKPKEALAVMNGTAVMSAIAMEAIKKIEVLLDTTESFVASIYELLLCDTTPVEPFVHESKPFNGQVQSAANILRKIEGSKLTHGYEERYVLHKENIDHNIQDRYSIRCAPQVIGVVRDNLAVAKQWVETEINGVNDNPLIDIENEKIFTSGNFYGGYVAHACDTLKIALGNIADLIDKEFALLVDFKYNNGIGENLKIDADDSHHGFKAMQITLSSLSADVLMRANAASLFSRPTESNNQDKVSMGTTASLQLKAMVPDLTNMLSIALLGMAQAVDIRGVLTCSPLLQSHHTKIRTVSDALSADRRMDKDIATIRDAILKGAFQ